VLGDIRVRGAEEQADALAKRCGPGRALALAVNVTDSASIESAMHQVVRTYGGLDLLVSNAGVLHAGSVKTQPEQDFDLVTQVNYKGYFLCVQNTAPTATDPATGKSTLTHTEQVLEVDWAYDLTEDAAMAILPSLRAEIARSAGEQMLDEARVEIAALTAENARLRAEVKKWCDACGCSDEANMALRAEDAGVSALFIHGRTKLQEYSGIVDYAAIRSVKKAVRIPVIASGDIFSGQLAKKMLEETGCDGIVVARGALGNPWLFKEIHEFIKNGKIMPRPDKEAIKTVMLEHLDANVAFYGERNGVVVFRKFFTWYTKGLRKIRHLREKSSRIKKREEMAAIIQAIP
jgi:hypothetical protein